MRKWRMMCCAAVIMAAFFTQTFALEYTVDGPDAGAFGTPTSKETIYEWNDPNINRGKDAALIPPGFGTPTSYLPGSGELLTPNLTAGGLPTSGDVATPLGGVAAFLPPTSIVGNVSTGTATRYTAVTSDLYYSGGHLGRLAIPTLGVNVKVYQGTDSGALAKGAGHFTYTSIWDGNVALAGHNRGTNCYFGDIHTLRAGDTVTLTTKMGTRHYAVTSVFMVSEMDNSMLAATTENCITLYTCVRDQSAYRWCVRAEEI